MVLGCPHCSVVVGITNVRIERKLHESHGTVLLDCPSGSNDSTFGLYLGDNIVVIGDYEKIRPTPLIEVAAWGVMLFCGLAIAISGSCL